MRLRRAVRDDLEAIRRLLDDARLPYADLSLDLGPFVVAEHRGDLVGSAGVERHGDLGLLRSVVVAPATRVAGIATWLCCTVTEYARRDGVRALFLLTTTAPDFFARLGFLRVERAGAPGPILATREFRELCPDSSVCMHRALNSPRGPATVSRLEAAYGAFLAGSPSDLMEMLDEGAVYHLPGRHLGGGRLDGRNAIVRRAVAAARALDEPPTVQLVDAFGDDSAVVTVERFRARREGRVLEQPVSVVWRFERSTCVEIRAHFEDQRECDAFWAGTGAPIDWP